jgi:hypothetical protein
MRKVLIVLAVFVFQGVAFSNEIGVKAGVDSLRRESYGGSSFKKKEIGFSLAAEYLGTINNFVKIGVGSEYVLPKSINYGGDAFKSKLKKEVGKKLKGLSKELEKELEVDKPVPAQPDPSYVPVYFSVKVTPIPTFFLKGNLGYSVYFDGMPKGSPSSSGGLYYAVGVGHEFLFGLTLDVTYSHYGCKNVVDRGFSRVALNLGYSFKLF